ncbi:MAG: hypothetical protein M3Z01_09295 [Thermoproteota archaeon]|nr:hypothetical protein [Thermoproteota archaeon]
MIRLTKTEKISIMFILGTFIVLLPCIAIGNANAQTYDKVISFPDINVTNSNNQNASLDQEFLVISNNGLAPLEVINPDFGLSPPFVKLIEGQKYVIDPLNDGDIKYTNITVKLAQVQFVSPDVTSIADADPEDPDTMTLGAPIDLAHSGGAASGFIMPSNLTPGNYILYAYLQYPDGITGVFSNLATVTGGSNSSNGQGSIGR